MRATITEKAGGNPFFIEEVVRELVDGGAIVEVDGRFRVTSKIVDVVIPSTVQEVIMVRIDRLDESKRHVLQLASVIGRSFSYGVIAELVDRARTLPDDLGELRDKQILVEQGPRWDVAVGERTIAEELEYMFKHALAQETIYSSILQQTRKELHGRVAGAIESRFADRLKEFFGTLSYHYLHAEDLPKAEDYSFRAGEEAARAGASREALQHFRDAARLDLELHGDAGRSAAPRAHREEHRPRADEHRPPARVAAALRPRHGVPRRARARQCARRAGQVRARPRRGGRRHVPAARVPPPAQRLGGGPRVLRDPERTRAGVGHQRPAAHLLRQHRRRPAHEPASSAQAFEPACPMYAVAGGMFSFSGLSFGLARRFLARAQACRTAGRPSDAFDCRSLEFTINYLAGRWRDEDVLEPGFVDEAIRNGLFWDVQNYLGLACDRLQRQGRFREARRHLDKLAELRDVYEFAFAGTNHDGESAMFHLERRDLDAARASVERYLTGREEYALCVLGLGTKAKILAHAGDDAGAAEALDAAQEILARSDVPPWHTSAYALARLQHDLAAVGAAAGGAADRALLARARKSCRHAAVAWRAPRRAPLRAGCAPRRARWPPSRRRHARQTPHPRWRSRRAGDWVTSAPGPPTAAPTSRVGVG